MQESQGSYEYNTVFINFRQFKMFTDRHTTVYVYDALISL